MMLALSFLAAIIAVVVVAVVAFDELVKEEVEGYRRNIRSLIDLLYHKGYCIEEIRNILNLYD